MYTLHHAALPGQSSLMAAVNLKKKRVCNASFRLAFSIDIGDLCSMKSHMRRVEFCQATIIQRLDTVNHFEMRRPQYT
ncbi:hypothetical protein SCLCIDRAFT_1217795 [Scleroderma citrinum Foug A]|uniref:Uncharacterized protein n=1 Tax=Scleroderma citrinum Foug A TaxID=1036808 RepID=A0A0C3DTZ2_9AGAM|nr:hypothetical protein SCLCIDRAFT_1217795 [Scleroderma citrinum Foug A]